MNLSSYAMKTFFKIFTRFLLQNFPSAARLSNNGESENKSQTILLRKIFPLTLQNQDQGLSSIKSKICIEFFISQVQDFIQLKLKMILIKVLVFIAVAIQGELRLIIGD